MSARPLGSGGLPPPLSHPLSDLHPSVRTLALTPTLRYRRAARQSIIPRESLQQIFLGFLAHFHPFTTRDPKDSASAEISLIHAVVFHGVEGRLGLLGSRSTLIYVFISRETPESRGVSFRSYKNTMELNNNYGNVVVPFSSCKFILIVGRF